MKLPSASQVLLVALTAAFVFHFGSDPHIATHSDVRLGEPGYHYKALEAPTAVGTTLRLFGWALTRTPLGPLLRRHLLDTNHVKTLRELAAQIPGVQPLTTPILRLPPAAREAHEAAAASAAAANLDTASVLAKGLGGGGGGGSSSEAGGGGSRIEAYHAAFRSGSLDPVEATRRVLAAARRLQPAYVPFAETREAEVRAQAEASAARWRAGAPLSVLDGVPVAVKDMIDTKVLTYFACVTSDFSVFYLLAANSSATRCSLLSTRRGT